MTRTALYTVQMLHTNPNANQVWTIRAANKLAARSAAHAAMVLRGVFFTTGDIRRAA